MLMRAVRRRVRAIAPAMVFLALAAYFGWNAARGSLGLRAYAARKQDLVQALAALDAAKAEDAAWSSRVAGLEPAHLDLDALDERARQLLNLSKPDDIIVPVKKK